jgi:hypothetical protein
LPEGGDKTDIAGHSRNNSGTSLNPHQHAVFLARLQTPILITCYARMQICGRESREASLYADQYNDDAISFARGDLCQISSE